VSGFKVQSVSTSGAPTIEFTIVGDTLRAELAGARASAEVDRDGKARLVVREVFGDCLADLTVHPRPGRNLTENVTDIASALLWSHWRWQRTAIEEEK
jgi:hypothetical protein